MDEHSSGQGEFGGGNIFTNFTIKCSYGWKKIGGEVKFMINEVDKVFRSMKRARL